MTLALAPEIAVDGAVLALSSGRRLRLVGFEDSISVRGVEEPFEGWHSRTYGQWEPSTWLKKQRPSTVLDRSEEHTSDLQSLMPTSYPVFCLTKKNQHLKKN